ncbi:hypothetical protein [Streptomyces sp. NPDC048473]|uniref:hypothetical protein n=1 Tax=Streptomyces sp. NPDC048473 TaxID=3365556 RepID=UPI003713AC02
MATEVHAGAFRDAGSKLAADATSTASVTLASLPAQVLDALTGHARTLGDGLGCRSPARIDVGSPVTDGSTRWR